ncbi:MAG: pyridoxal-phosphate dependent enzyme [Thaumarchaeota archaeon]|nr:pyridoxal-phosphate dependent enzyme [Nitrososphaerota archaeon]
MLLRSFRNQVAGRVPRRQADGTISNPTPLREITDIFLDCAKDEYGIDLSARGIRVFGKFDSEIFGGSVKVRPAVQILDDAIAAGRVKRGQTVFEATSGNFGIALGLLGKTGVQAVALVSRKLQEGVVEELKDSGVKTVDLDVEVCPTPGALLDVNIIAAKAAASNLRSRLADLGFDVGTFDGNIIEIEALLARQDVINLAKLLAQAYGGFCTEQYDNEKNLIAHETVTGPEMEQQLRGMGQSMGDFTVVCSLGTGGTSTGLSRYIQQKYNKRTVHVIFPLSGQDVAGIRTRANASGLRFYDPTAYAGEHEVDFEEARKLLAYFVGRGISLGESSALALYATVQLANFGSSNNFLVLIPDGAKKYAKSTAPVAEARVRSISLQQAKTGRSDYGRVIWTHSMFVPKDEGVKLIASALGCAEDVIMVVGVQDVQRIVSTNDVPSELLESVRQAGSKHLFLCMAGMTSLKVAQAFAAKGLNSDNLAGGIMGLATLNRKQASELVRQSS